MRTLVLVSVVFLGCGDDGGGAGTDAAPTVDSSLLPIDAPAVDAPSAPAMITLTGRATARAITGTQPVADATIAAYRSSDEATAVATTTTDAQGNFTLTVATGGTALEGFLKATKANHATTYLYTPEPIAADTANVPINMLTTGNYGTLYTLTQVQEGANTGVVAMVVTDANDMPVPGATITSTPAGTYRYNGNGGLPNASASQTAADGTAYVMNAAPGPMTLDAAKAGSTFRANTVKVFPESLTTTLIIPQ